jgi:hypothetical protein
VQINESKIAFICFHLFFRIGTFQRVTSEKIKNFSLRLSAPWGCKSNVSNSLPTLSFPASHWRKARADSASANKGNTVSDFLQQRLWEAWPDIAPRG